MPRRPAPRFDADSIRGVREVTPFQDSVYQAVARIPAGQVMTYIGVARTIGCGSARAIGQALRRNPYAPDIPCHRVIAADRSLGGFNGRYEGPDLVRKRKLLEKEGVTFEADGKVAETCIAQPKKRP